VLDEVERGEAPIEVLAWIPLIAGQMALTLHKRSFYDPIVPR
jgi:hypothetical protein